MIKQVATAALLMILAGCGGPQEEDLYSAGRSTGADAVVLAEPVVEDAPVAAAPVATDVSCDDPGDGIGGTGCSVD